MTRVKRGKVARKRRNRFFSLRGARSRCSGRAKQETIKALCYAYRARRERSRRYRSIWVVRLNAAVSMHGLKYSSFLNLISQKKCLLTTKTLAHLAVCDPSSINRLITSSI